MPIIILALFNIVTQYKLQKVSKRRFQHQIILWGLILVVLLCSFPLYNYISDKPLLDSGELSLFDIAQTTAIIIVVYIINSQRRKIERAEKTIRDLHQELSIRLSSKK
jgi:hypothetical protein